MATFAEQVAFLSVVHRLYGRWANFEIEACSSAVECDLESDPQRLRIFARLLLGKPERIGGRTIYPIEIECMGSYDSARDRALTAKQAFRIAIQRTLDSAWPGASVLVERWHAHSLASEAGFITRFC